MDGAPLSIGKTLPGQDAAALFVSPHCPLCKDLIPIARICAAEKAGHRFCRR